MSVQSTDLLLVQRANQPYRATAENLADYANANITVGVDGDVDIASASQVGAIRVGANLSIDPATGILSAIIPAGLEYQGTYSDPNTPPSNAQNGYFYIWDGGAATLTNALWGDANGEAIVDGDRIFYNGTSFEVLPAQSGGGIDSISGTSPISVDTTTDPTTPDISITPASGSSACSMLSSDFSKLSNIEAGAQVNVNPSMAYTAAASIGTLTLSPGSDSTQLPQVTTTQAGLMSAADKVTLDGLSSNPSGVTSVAAGEGITVTGPAAVPVINVTFVDTPNGTPNSSLPYDISMLGDLP